MERLEGILDTVNYSLNTSKKRHIIGGILMSMSLLFGGLVLTVMSLKQEELKDE